MNYSIGEGLEKRYTSYRYSLAHGNLAPNKSIVGLVLQGYLEPKRSQKAPPQLDPTFKTYPTSQIRTLLFAGHGTTSSTICHIYYLLSKYLSFLEKLCSEHDSVLGIHLDAAGKLIAVNPHLLNQLTYTFAVIKEAMRLFPPASGVRDGVDGVSITNDTGQTYPTGKTAVWILHPAMQLDPNIGNSLMTSFPSVGWWDLKTLCILSKGHGGLLSRTRLSQSGRSISLQGFVPKMISPVTGDKHWLNLL